MTSPIKAITFDLDDTLWPLKPTLINAETECYKWLQENAKPLTDKFSVEDIAAYRFKIFSRSDAFKNQISQLRIETIKAMATECGYSHQDAIALSAAAFEVHYALRQQVNCYAGVESMLETLQKNFIIGSISNGNADVKQTAIGRFFSFALSAEKLNMSKPQTGIFTAALHHINTNFDAPIAANQVVHVGDDFYCDVVGAKRAGFKAIWLTNDEHRPAPSTPYLAPEDIEAAQHYSADAVIESTGALIDTIRSMQQTS
tara:strand:+ start:9299 stop:10072 length:774 start_codon:yes stop_codon:yes gene_type:complete